MADTGDNAKEETKVLTPNENQIDISPDKDFGVLKEIKKEGTGEEKPGSGEKVFVHYVGTLEDGTKFDSSRDRNDQFSFQLAKGSVIKAWDIGVATMKRGEIAVLTCRSDYAYGENGSPPKIPPNATLIFEIELFDWQGEDVSRESDGSVIRHIIESGDGLDSPNDRATVDVHLVGMYNGKEFENRDVQFEVGLGLDKGVIEGIDEAITKFHKGERSNLKIKSKLAFGSEGNSEYGIPPGADVEYEVTLNNFEKAKSMWEMEPKERLDQGEILKQKGTEYFKKEQYSKSTIFWKKSLDLLEYSSDKFEGEDKTRQQALLIATNLNMAMNCLKSNQPDEALEFTDTVLKINPKNEKALYRKGLAKMGIKEYGEAIWAFQSVLDMDPDNKAAKNQIIISNQKIKAQKEKEKKLYAGMFQKFVAQDEKPSENEEIKSANEEIKSTNEETVPQPVDVSVAS